LIQTPEQFSFLNMLCNKICDESHIRFCGVINSMGKLIAGSFRDGILPLDTDVQREMLYMQSRLELSMKAEFNDNLGDVNHVITYRDNVVIITLPLKNQQYHILISAERIADIKKIVDKTVNLFQNNRRCENKKKISKSFPILNHI
jgi:hypothetical protein